MLKVGVVGCGHVSINQHIPCLQMNQKTELISICDLDRDVAKQTAKRFNIPTFYENALKMFSQESLDLVHICTPPKFHKKIAMAALDAGSHILIEKPFVLKVSEADQIIRKAEREGCKLSVIHNYLFTPVMLEAQRKVKQGHLGRMTSVHAFFGDNIPFIRNWISQLPGRRFGENLPHPIYTVLAFMKSVKIRNVTTLKLHKKSPDPYDELQVELAGRDILGYISLTKNCPRSKLVLLSGTKLTVFVDILTGLLVENPLRGYQPSRRVKESEGIMRLVSRGVEKIKRLGRRRARYVSPQRITGRPHYYQIDAFVEAILRGTNPPVTPEEAREVVRLYEQILEKAGK